MRNILVTGSSGFIGFHLSKRLLSSKSNNVIGIDNMNDYYDFKLKKDRLKILSKYKNFSFYKSDIQNSVSLKKIFIKHNFNIVINLAAQAGVRNSINDPDTYFKYNINGFYEILKKCTEFKIEHLVYASSSSVYGPSTKYPFNENLDTSLPKSFYAATKKVNEVIAHSFSDIYNLKATGMRFFTVYGPYGRPDMSLYKFLNSIYNNKPIELFNSGNHFRDFTYIEDCIDGITILLNRNNKNFQKHEIFNIGNGNSRPLVKFINEIKKNTSSKKIKIKKLPMQRGDVFKTHSSLKKINKIKQFKPKYNIETGIKLFIDWYRKYYLVK